MASNDIKDLKINITELTEKVDGLSSKLSNIEVLISNRTKFSLNNSNDVETFQNRGEEDMLIPQDLFFFSEGIQKTAKQLLMLRLGSADDVSKLTNRERAVESAYLNELEELNKCRKMRISRKMYFYISHKRHLDTFADIPKEWREFFIIFFKTFPLENEEVKIDILELIKTYRKSDLIPDTVSDEQINQLISSYIISIRKDSDIISDRDDELFFIKDAWINFNKYS